MSLPRVMRVPRTLKHGHYYIDPTGIEIYAHWPSKSATPRFADNSNRF